jgi:hypothetical protein
MSTNEWLEEKIMFLVNVYLLFHFWGIHYFLQSNGEWDECKHKFVFRYANLLRSCIEAFFFNNCTRNYIRET